MKRTLSVGGCAVLALLLLVGCGSGDAPAPAIPPVSITDAPSSGPTTPSTSSATSSGPGGGPAPSGAAGIPGAAAPGPDGAAPPGAGPTVPGAGPAVPGAGPAVVPVPPAAAPSNATTAYAARFCTALLPLVAFKQQNETPNMAGVTDSQGAKAFAVRLIADGVSTAQAAVRSVTDLGPAPDPQAAAGVNALLASLGQAITTGQSLLPQVQAVDPANPTALFPLAIQARSQLGSSQATGLGALRTSTGPAMAAALHTVPQCAPLGV